MGNLGVQRMFEGLVKLRGAYGPGSGKAQHPDVEAYMAAHGGRDPFGERGEAEGEERGGGGGCVSFPEGPEGARAAEGC